jgi:hypothetical protein
MLHPLARLGRVFENNWLESKIDGCHTKISVFKMVLIKQPRPFSLNWLKGLCPEMNNFEGL